MKRRSFLQVLGFGAAATAVPNIPQAAERVFEPIPPLEKEKYLVHAGGDQITCTFSTAESVRVSIYDGMK